MRDSIKYRLGAFPMANLLQYFDTHVGDHVYEKPYHLFDADWLALRR
jgi:hypothetical protein